MLHPTRDSTVAARRAHNPAGAGSNPAPATKRPEAVSFGLGALFRYRLLYRAADPRPAPYSEQRVQLGGALYIPLTFLISGSNSVPLAFPAWGDILSLELVNTILTSTGGDYNDDTSSSRPLP